MARVTVPAVISTRFNALALGLAVGLSLLGLTMMLA